jgi:DNA-binding CsgD family transcriptional regulator
VSEVSDGTEDQELYWRGVVGRSLAYLCLDAAELTKRDIATKASFLVSLGLTRKDVASILQTTEETVRVTLQQSKSRGKRKARTKGRSAA